MTGFFARAAPSPPATPGAPTAGDALVVYSPGYRVSFFGIERLHPFDIRKYDRIAAALVEAGAVDRASFAVPEEATAEALAAVHDPAYLESLRRPEVLSQALEVPIPGFVPGGLLDSRVLRPMRRAVAGTVVAARWAVGHGFAVNLGGGYHHARPALGHGFCVYNDVALAVHTLREDGFDGRILIVDTDAHQGDGNHTFFTADPTVTTLSMHQSGIFPQPRVPGNVDIELPAGADDSLFLAKLRAALRANLRGHSLVFHVAGADVLDDDPLAGLGLTLDGLVERDALVFREVRGAGIPLVHLLAGGYGPTAAEAQARSVVNLLNTAGETGS